MILRGKTVGVFVAEGFEDLEFWVPVMRLREEGAQVVIIGLTDETVRGKHCLEATPDRLALYLHNRVAGRKHSRAPTRYARRRHRACDVFDTTGNRFICGREWA